MLYQLPNSGDWVSLLRIVDIAVYDTESIGVYVTLQDGGGHAIPCADIGEARRVRDELAARANASSITTIPGSPFFPEFGREYKEC